MALRKSSPPSGSIPPAGRLSEVEAKQLDEALHAQRSRATLGLSPISRALACIDWLNKHSTWKMTARNIDQGRVLCDASGDYVMVRYADTHYCVAS
ncbi:MAG: hypothetical protein EBZ75_03530 [Oxalobacteraceae bacterium]|nr:hypothetical protein [Oxalobacteraceae bacterium]